MLPELRSAIAVVREMVGAFGPDRVDGAQAAVLVEQFTELERLAVAGRTLAARRVAETNLWQREGHRTPAQWVAAVTAMPVGQAIGVLETAEALGGLPAVREAFVSGELSEVQVREIASAASADPSAEAGLLAVASQASVAGLRNRCSMVRAAAHPDGASRYAAIHRSRYLRIWSEPDGAVKVAARLTPDAGGAFASAIEARQDRIFAEARAAGLIERAEACAADALVELATGAEGPRATLTIVVDEAALERGRVQGSERCEIPGVGPVPVAMVSTFVADAAIKMVARNDADITRVSHLGRTINARLQTALEVRDPVCVVPRCDARRGLQIDHWRVRHAIGGRTELANLARLCRWHHYQKTYLGYRLGGGPGAWWWITPDDAEGRPEGEARPPPDG